MTINTVKIHTMPIQFTQNQKVDFTSCSRTGASVNVCILTLTHCNTHVPQDKWFGGAACTSCQHSVMLWPKPATR